MANYIFMNDSEFDWVVLETLTGDAYAVGEARPNHDRDL